MALDALWHLMYPSFDRVVRQTTTIIYTISFSNFAATEITPYSTFLIIDPISTKMGFTQFDKI